ncbi:MAG: hypothetical protein HC869_21160 [Rhodospirillales bacterium]|nr:hypothetical protein [Rhodospirillales bacterium]
MKPWLIGCVVAGALATSDVAADPVEPTSQLIDPVSLYGSEILFDVYRNGDIVGFHSVRFSSSGPDLTVQSKFQLQIDFWFLTAFRYVYRSEERWRQEQLEGLNAMIDDNGKASALDVAREGSQLRIKSAADDFTTYTPLFPTTHWNAGVLKQTRVLNTLTGRINQVRIEPGARQTVMTERGAIPATRYAYSGELETEVWYDDAGRWVKMRFEGRDSSMIEYVCRRCQGTRVSKDHK